MENVLRRWAPQIAWRGGFFVRPIIMQKRWSIRTYLWLLALAVAIPCAGLLIYTILSEARHDQDQVATTTLSLAQLVGSQTKQFLGDAENLATKLSQSPTIRAMDPNQRDPMFDQFIDLHPQFANLVVCDTSGKVIHSAIVPPADKSLDLVRAQWSDAVLLNGRFTVGKPIIGRLTHRWVCVLGCPIRNQDGKVIGVLGMPVDLARFNVAVNPVNLPPNSTITIIDREGTIIMRSPGSQTWIGKPARGMEIADFVLANEEGHRIAGGDRDETRIYGFTSIHKAGWHVYVGIPASFAFASAKINMLRTTLAGASLLCAVVAAVIFLGRHINEPVNALFRAATDAAEGRPQTVALVSGPREIAAVAEEFNRMLAVRKQKELEIQQLNLELEQRVKERTAALEKTNAELTREIAVRKRTQEALRNHRQELQDYIDGMSTMNAKVAPDGKILLVNKTAREASGLAPEVLLKTNFLEGQWWTFDPSVEQRVLSAFASACGGAPVNYDEKFFVFGKVIDINFSLIPVRGEKGEVEYIVAEGRDITQRKQAEAALAERTLQLEGANKELEAFSYSVSHDLRAPLRGIDGFTKALLEDYADKLGDEGRQYLQRVRGAAQRMAHLIDDLLELSRISRSAMRHDVVDLSLTANQIAAGLKEANPERSVNFTVQPDLTVPGDARLMRVMLENLLNNAWKFSRDRNPAQIEFGAEEVNSQKAFFVRDNGAGFDMAYLDKLFGAFQRLHSAEEYEGTGIGLATVQRIIHRHGGRVWAEGAIDKGATFYFTVPG